MELQASDHTRVMTFLQENIFEVLKNLNPANLILNNKNPTQLEILRAILKCKNIDKKTHRIISEVIRIYPIYYELQQHPEVRHRTIMIQTDLKKIKNIKNMKIYLEKLKELYTKNEKYQVVKGIETAIEILEDGEGIIYV